LAPLITLIALLLSVLSGCEFIPGGAAAATPTPTRIIQSATRRFLLEYSYVHATPTAAPILQTSVIALDAYTGALLWRHALEKPGAITINALQQPFERDGVVYVIFHYDTQSAISRGVLEALAVESGQTLWRHETDGEIAGPPAVDGARVYLSSAGLRSIQPPFETKQSVVEALNTHDGSLRWSATVDGAVGAPTVAGGLIYLFARPVPLQSNVSGTGNLLALKSGDGAVAWLYNSPEPLGGQRNGQSSSPLVVDERVYAYAIERDPNGVVNPLLLAFGARDGAALWRYKTGGITFMPAFAANIMCVSTRLNSALNSASAVVGLNIADGSVRWRVESEGLASPCVTDGERFYLTHTGKKGGVRAFSVADGHTLWDATSGDPVIANGLIPVSLSSGLVAAYIASPSAADVRDTKLVVARASDGKQVWNYLVPGRAEDAPQIDGDVVYAPVDQELLAFSLRDGKALWRYQTVRRS
jgi:outer membrane protein assembly factor BamB